jgi:hypothetical protein
VKKVNKNRPALRENSPALLCIFSGQTAPSPQHYTRNAPITKIGNITNSSKCPTSISLGEKTHITKDSGK